MGSLPGHTRHPFTTHLFGVGQVFQFSRRADVFIAPRDYSYFLQFYARHVLPVVDTYAYGASGAIVSTC